MEREVKTCFSTLPFPKMKHHFSLMILMREDHAFQLPEEFLTLISNLDFLDFFYPINSLRKIRLCLCSSS